MQSYAILPEPLPPPPEIPYPWVDFEGFLELSDIRRKAIVVSAHVGTWKEYFDENLKCGQLPADHKAPGCGACDWRPLRTMIGWELICQKCFAHTWVEVCSR